MKSIRNLVGMSICMYIMKRLRTLLPAAGLSPVGRMGRVSVLVVAVLLASCSGTTEKQAVGQQPAVIDSVAAPPVGEVDHFALGIELMEKNKQRPEVTTLPSGLQYEVLSSGSGKSPAKSDHVRCHYEGRLADGTLIDSSVKRGKPAVLKVNEVINGWMEALLLMNEGARWRIYIPYHLGYGEMGVEGRVPAFSALVFEVELIEVL